MLSKDSCVTWEERILFSALPFRSSTASGSGVLGVRGESGFSGTTGNIAGGAAPGSHRVNCEKLCH